MPVNFKEIAVVFVSSFFSSDFTDESEGILAYRITHGISRIFGRWPMACALYMLLLLFVTQISQMTQIFLCVDYFVPQISQIYTDFSLWDKIFIGFPGWIGRHSCLSDFSRIFAELWPLANSSHPIYVPVAFCHADFADDADFFIHRITRNLFGGFPDEAINHGFSRRRPVRSVQIPPESGQRDSTEIP